MPSQNFAPSPPSPAQIPRMSRSPAVVTPKVPVTHLEHDRVDEDHRIHAIQRSIGPFRHFLDHLVGDLRDGVLGDIGTIDLAEVPQLLLRWSGRGQSATARSHRSRPIGAAASSRSAAGRNHPGPREHRSAPDRPGRAPSSTWSRYGRSLHRWPDASHSRCSVSSARSGSPAPSSSAHPTGLAGRPSSRPAPSPAPAAARRSSADR